MELVPFRHWVVARADDDHTALRFEDREWSYREWTALCAQRAAFLLANRREGAPPVGAPPGGGVGRWSAYTRRGAAQSSRVTSATPTASSSSPTPVTRRCSMGSTS